MKRKSRDLPGAQNDFLLKMGVMAFMVFLGLGCFIHKPVHVDDALFLASADQIVRDPLKPYGFPINWFGTPVSMWEATQNPPLASYLLAIPRAMGWEQEWVAHLLMLMPSLGAVIGMGFLAARFCNRPCWVAATMTVAPAFFVSATNLMPDVLLLCLMIWAMECWLRGLDGKGRWWFVASSFLACMAVMTKYFGITLLILLPLLNWMRGGVAPRRSMAVPGVMRGIFFLLPCIAVVAAWNFYSHREGGIFHLLGAAKYSVETAWRHGVANVGITTAFVGGGFWFPVVLLPWMMMRMDRLRLLIVILVVVGMGGILGSMDGGKIPFWILMEWGVMALATVMALGMMFPQMRSRLLGHPEGGEEFQSGPRKKNKGSSVRGLLKRKVTWREGVLGVRNQREDVFLWSWLGGVLVFVVFFNWTVSVRALLPGLPPFLILLVRKVFSQRMFVSNVAQGLRKVHEGRWWEMGAIVKWSVPISSLVLSLILAGADFTHAQANRDMADEAESLRKEGEGEILFSGHWGFQYYMERKGFHALDYLNVSELDGSERIFFAMLNNTNANPVPTHTRLLFRKRVPNPWGLACVSVPGQAGFYSSRHGILPFGWSDQPAEIFLLMGKGKEKGE